MRPPMELSMRSPIPGRPPPMRGSMRASPPGILRRSRGSAIIPPRIPPGWPLGSCIGPPRGGGIGFITIPSFAASLWICSMVFGPVASRRGFHLRRYTHAGAQNHNQLGSMQPFFVVMHDGTHRHDIQVCTKRSNDDFLHKDKLFFRARLLLHLAEVDRV